MRNNYSYEDLRIKNTEELKIVARTLGMGTPEGEKRQTLLKRILEITIQAPQERPKEEKVKTSKKVKPPLLSQEEVLRALERHIERGLKVTFDEKCFCISAGAKQDSGTLYQPLPVIVRCAEAFIRTV